MHMCLHDQVSVLFLFYWKQPVVLCGVRLELMMELAHNWFRSVPFRVSICSPCPVRGGQGGCGRRPSGWPRGARSPRSGLGGAQGRASGRLPSASSEPEQSQAVQGLSHGGRYAASPPSQLRGWGSLAIFPPTAHFLHPWDTVPHSSLLLPQASKTKNSFSCICQHCSWCFACFN